MEDKGTTLIAWNKVCKPKDGGGLGVLDLAIHNKCLLMKHAHKFLNRMDLPWVKLIWSSYYPNGIMTDRPVGSFWWKNICKLAPVYKSMVQCTIGQGNTIQVWTDEWGHGTLQYEFPHLFSYIKKPTITTSQWMNADNATEIYHTPMSSEAYQELQLLQDLHTTIQIEHVPDN